MKTPISNNHYKIEKDIPIAFYGKGDCRWMKLATAMDAGDSVLVNGRNEAMNMRNAIVRLGCKCVTRMTDSINQIRVWKVTK